MTGCVVIATSIHIRTPFIVYIYHTDVFFWFVAYLHRVVQVGVLVPHDLLKHLLAGLCGEESVRVRSKERPLDYTSHHVRNSRPVLHYM